MKRSIITYINFIVIAIFASSCSKDPVLSGNLSSQIILTTQAASSIAQNTAVSGVWISGGYTSDIIEQGICWATTINPTTNGNKRSGGLTGGFKSLTLTGLMPGTTYYIRGYVTTKNETIYGDQKQLRTLGYQLATITTTAVTSITRTTALSGGNVTALGVGSVTSRGICWNTASNPTVLNSKTSDGSGLGIYSSSLSDLNPGTLYYVRAYGINEAGTVYGPQVSFITTGISLPAVSSLVVGSVTSNTAVSSAIVTADGGGTITSKGVCWGTVPAPTILNSHTNNGSGLSSYSSVMSGLSPGVTYYVRAYATNQAGTAYGTQAVFTTNAIRLATVTGITISGINRATAIFSANVTADGGSKVTSRGVCWSTSINPTVPGSAYTGNGSGTGYLSGSLSGLITGTTYYIRAYAINTAGIAYGALSSFRTL